LNNVAIVVCNIIVQSVDASKHILFASEYPIYVNNIKLIKHN